MCMLVKPFGTRLNPFWIQEIIYFDIENDYVQVYLTLALENLKYLIMNRIKGPSELCFLHRGEINKIIDQSETIRKGNKYWLQELTNASFERKIDVNDNENTVELSHRVKSRRPGQFQPIDGYPAEDVMLSIFPEMDNLDMWPDNEFKKSFELGDDEQLFTTFSIDDIPEGLSIYRIFFKTKIGVHKFLEEKRAFFEVFGPTIVEERLWRESNNLRPEIAKYFRDRIMPYRVNTPSIQYDVILVEPIETMSSIESGFPYKQETTFTDWYEPHDGGWKKVGGKCIARIFTPYSDEFMMSTISEYDNVRAKR